MSVRSETVDVLFVRKREARFVKAELESMGYLHKDFRMIASDDDTIAVPIKGDVYCEFPEWREKVRGKGRHECPYSTAKLGNSRLSLNDPSITLVQLALMNWLNGGESIKSKIELLSIQVCPRKLERFGDDRTLVVPRKAFSLDDPSFRSLIGDSKVADLWEILAEVYNSPRVVRRGDIDPDSPIRESGHEILWPCTMNVQETGRGSAGWITVTEQGIRQSFDMTRVMFSRGNITEKIRFGKLVKVGEVVLDIYAGIGYYTLPALIHGKASHVHACEWNEHAVFALRYNLKQNGVDDRATVYVGDCRKIAKNRSLVDMCDRVCLGLLPSSEGGWRTAVKALKHASGGWLHIHGNVPEAEWMTWTMWVCWRLSEIARGEVSPDWLALCMHVGKVKSYAPKIFHYVADVFVGPGEALQYHGVQVETDGSQAGILLSVNGRFEPCRPFPEKPSCALDPCGVLHQEWMMEND
jgi:tRNA G37 N-methylase Trm5